MLLALLVAMCTDTGDTSLVVDLCSTQEFVDIKTLTLMFKGAGLQLILKEEMCEAPVLSYTAEGDKRVDVEVKQGSSESIFSTFMGQAYPPSPSTPSITLCTDLSPAMWAYIVKGDLHYTFTECDEERLIRIALSPTLHLTVPHCTAEVRAMLSYYVYKESTLERQVLPLKGLTVRGPSDSVQSVIEQLRTAGELEEFTVIEDERVPHATITLQHLTATSFSENLIYLKQYNEIINEAGEYHVPESLIGLFLNTARLPAVLIVYKPKNFREAEKQLLFLSCSLSHSTLIDYTAAMCVSEKIESGVYYMTSANDAQLIETVDILPYLQQVLSVYLPAAQCSVRDKTHSVRSVYGEQHLQTGDYHRGNLNNPALYELGDLASDMFNKQMHRRATDRRSITEGDMTLYMLGEEDQPQGFVIFYYRYDIPSLALLSSLLTSNNTYYTNSTRLVECFNYDLVCKEYGVVSFPTVLYFGSKNHSVYWGTVTQHEMEQYTALVKQSTVTTLSREQAQLMLEEHPYTAVLLIAPNKTLLTQYEQCCELLKGQLQCFTLTEDSSQSTLVLHSSVDSVEVNKHYVLPADSTITKELLLALRVPSIISLPSPGAAAQLALFDRYIVFDSATPEDTLHNAITSHPLIKFVLCDEHDVMVELLGYHRQGTIVLVCKKKGVGYVKKHSEDVNSWIQYVIEGTIEPSFTLKPLGGLKVQYENVFYKKQFDGLKSGVEDTRDRVNMMRGIGGAAIRKDEL